MIKVNLLKDAGKKQKKSDSTILDSEFKTNLTGAMGNNSVLIKRIVILVFPFMAAFIYSWYIENGLENNIKDLIATTAEVDTKMQNLKPELDIIDQLKVEKNKLSMEVAALKELSKKRYALAKVMDSLQNLIPEKAWMMKMNIKDQVISIEGRATEDSVISLFMQSLEESPYFSNVTWVDSREVTEPQGVVKSFNIRFNLENI